LLNNFNPGSYGSGANAYADIGNPNETVFTIPPSPLHTIGDRIEKNISWAYHGDQWNAYLANPDGNLVTGDNTYCNICNPFQYITSMMSNPSGSHAPARPPNSMRRSRTARCLPFPW
jgi:phospholipase C